MKVKEQPVRVSKVHIDVQLTGPIAKTTIEISIFNPNDRILEGEFNFPLADGQSISRFALDIDGQMREGVAVDKAKAQKFFESIVRRQVDPGLIEKTQGNNFRSRVYPIPAQGTRRIIIGYEEELSCNADNYIYTLPFYYGNDIDLSINMEAWGYSRKPEIIQTLSGKLKFKNEDDKFIAQYHKDKQKNTRPVILSIPVDKAQNSLIETDPKTQENTFYSRIFPRLNSDAKILPEKIAIYWDTSLSMEDKDIKKEIDFLDNYFKLINNAQIKLYTFNISLKQEQNYQVNNGNWNELRKALLAARYDGATSVGNIKLTDEDADAILLFSDGINNFSKGSIEYKNIPVYAITSVMKADHNALKYMAIVSGGKYIDLLKQDIRNAVNAMGEQNFRLISAEYDKNEISDVAFLQYISNPENGFSITGKLIAQHAKIKLNFGIGHQVLVSETIDISDSKTLKVNNIIKRIWAEKRIADLEIIYEVNKEEIEALGREYNIVTQNTSLIVLEDLNDYVEFRITPPEELLVDYNKKIEKLDSGEKNRKNIAIQREEKNRLQEIEKTVNLLSKKKEWWIKDFPKTAPPKLKNKNNGEANGRSIDIADLSEHKVIMEERYPEPVFMRVERGDFLPENEESKEKPEETKDVFSKNPTIRLKEWNPDMPYMEVLNTVSNDKLYDTYYSIRKDYKNTPSFYVDVSILMQNRGLYEDALLVLSNLAEIELENYRLLRVLAHRLLHTNHTEYSIYQFETVKRLRPEEPQSFRDLALAYDQHKEYQKALDIFTDMIETPFGRFHDIKLYATEEMNNMLERAKRENITLDIRRIDSRLLNNMPVDIRIIMSWDSDNTDIDLWVTDPHDQNCFYGHKETYNGGMYFSDFTGGYGPETYQIREAIKGKYTITAKYFADHSQSITGPTSIYLDIFTQYATDKEKKETIIVRLDNAKEEITVGEIVY